MVGLSTSLTKKTLEKGVKHMMRVQPEFQQILNHPDVARRLALPQDNENIFGMLARSIAYQQLSMASATAIWNRVLALCRASSDRDLHYENVLSRTADEFRAAGLSQRKSVNLRALASRFQSGELRNDLLINMPESELVPLLMESPGIGKWTVDIVCMFRLGKLDILPTGDLEIKKEIRNLFRLDHLPTPREMESLTEHWRPYRSLGSYCLFIRGRDRRAH